MSLAKGSRLSGLHYLLSLFVGLLPVVFGAIIIEGQASRMLEQRTENTLRKALGEFDMMLDRAAATARAVLPYSGQHCDGVDMALRDQVVRSPFVRSANLVWGDNLYCSSLFSGTHETIDSDDYVNGSLRLLAGNSVTPDSPLLVYRESEGLRSALIAIDGFHVKNALRLIAHEGDLYFQVGEVWTTANGKIMHTPAPSYPVAERRAQSLRYPYRVVSGLPAGETWRFIMAQYSPLLVFLIFLGGMAAVATQWIQQHAGSTRRELKRALAAGEFVPYFQPIVDSQTLQWAGVEVLMRWDHPSEGLVRPDLFIPAAEDCGLIVPMTCSLIQQTAELLAPHAQAFATGFHVSVNITAQQCRTLDIIEDCRHFLGHFAPGAVTLVLELTEREMIDPSPLTHQLFEQLHDLGVLISLDDFGTGHSSLNYLRELHVDYLKIDRSFVAMIGSQALSRHILDSIIELCGKLNLGVVAEGVETSIQRDYLIARNVDLLQGYFFARPMSPEDIIKTLYTQRDAISK